MPLPNGEQYEAPDIHRLKGRVVREDGSVMLIQGVREVFEIFGASERGVEGGAERDNLSGKLVLIGRKLDGERMKDSLRWFVLAGDEYRASDLRGLVSRLALDAV